MDKPKRKYTVTEKSLAANRRNLIRAREVDPKIRYRPTPKRLAACHANLSRAHEVLRAASLKPDGYPRKLEIRNQKSEAGKTELEDRNSNTANRQSTISNRQWSDSPAYGLGYTRGLCAISLRRSGRLAGEAAGAFDAHVARFVAALAPRTLREQRLARGIAQTVWRRLRAFRGQSRYERAGLAWFLQRAADGRDLLWVRAGRPGPGPFAEEGESASLTPLSRAANLAWQIDRTLSSDLDMLDGVEKLNVRLERLSRLWVVERGGDPRLFELHAPGRVRDGLLAARSPESMGNPFLHPCAVAAGMAGHAGGGFRPLSARNWEHTSDFDWRDPVDAGEAFQRFEMLRDFCRETSPEGKCFAGAETGAQNGLDLANPAPLEELWARAWEAISSYGHTSCSVIVSGYIPSEACMPGPDKLNADSPTPRPSEPITNALWSRLKLYAQTAEKEAAEVENLLDTKMKGRMRSEFKARLGEIRGGATLGPAHDGETGVFLNELILLFNRTHLDVAEQRITGKTLSDSLHEFLLERFGPSHHFDLFRPSTCETRMREWIDRRRSALEQRRAQNTDSLSRNASRQAGGTVAIRLGEDNAKVAAELASLSTFAKDFEQEILDSHSEELVDKVWAEGRMDPERAQRCLAAAATGMLDLSGWKFESRARCQARMGLKKKLKVKS